MSLFTEQRDKLREAVTDKFQETVTSGVSRLIDSELSAPSVDSPRSQNTIKQVTATPTGSGVIVKEDGKIAPNVTPQNPMMQFVTPKNMMIFGGAIVGIILLIKVMKK